MLNQWTIARTAFLVALIFLNTLFSNAWAGSAEIGSENQSNAVSKHLTPEDIGVVVNDADPLSIKVAEYYRTERGIPKENLVHVSLLIQRPIFLLLNFNNLNLK